MTTIVELLDAIAEYQAERDALTLKKQELIDAVLTPEIRKQIEDIEGEFCLKSAAAIENIDRMTAEVKALVLKAGSTVKGSYLMAVWAKGREGGWDNGKLKGFAMAHPEILAAKNPDGEPTVSIRKI
jgi:hypothetical protein